MQFASQDQSDNTILSVSQLFQYEIQINTSRVSYKMMLRSLAAAPRRWHSTGENLTWWTESTPHWKVRVGTLRVQNDQPWRKMTWGGCLEFEQRFHPIFIIAYFYTVGSAMVDKSTGPVGRRQDWKKAIQESHTWLCSRAPCGRRQPSRVGHPDFFCRSCGFRV